MPRGPGCSPAQGAPPHGAAGQADLAGDAALGRNTPDITADPRRRLTECRGRHIAGVTCRDIPDFHRRNIQRRVGVVAMGWRTPSTMEDGRSTTPPVRSRAEMSRVSLSSVWDLGRYCQPVLNGRT
jgi:hypothetical protein